MEISHSAFTFQPTEDQSLTLRVSTPEGPSEAMHSLKGAFSETIYIYGTAIELGLAKGFEPRVLSLGLGLGYVELLAVALTLKHADSLSEQEYERFMAKSGGESFELLAPLRQWFAAWVLAAPNANLDIVNSPTNDSATPVPTDFVTAYEGILSRTAEATGVATERIRMTLAKMLADGRWKIRPALDANTEFISPFGVICFDAFSSKTSPDLWTEEFLQDFFAKTCAAECVLSTYACTGALKRALRAAGFELSIREGFASKRDSTFAVRTNPPA
jgi:hypothetical protein